ncbi:MAG: DNA-processing protein DprA [Planctomycetota bacterium]
MEPKSEPHSLDEINAELQGRTSKPSRIRRRSRDQDAVAWLHENWDQLPPKTAAEIWDDDTRDRLRLMLVPGVGPRTMTALLDAFGSASEILSAAAESLSRVAGVGPKLVSQIKAAKHLGRHDKRSDLDEIATWCFHHDTRLLVKGHAEYPTMLDDLPDAPPLLFCRGDVLPSDQLAVAIVGTRHPTPYGKQQAQRFAHALAKAGVTVISGLARGIDAAAHEGALDGGGRTIAVLGGGLAEMYPPENGGLAAAIAADGAVISEHPPALKPRSSLFPQRNRLVAGLAVATLVIEAPQRSGSLITARLCGEMSRDVLALPGNVTSRMSRGCHELIRDGAILVRHVDDVLESLGPLRAAVPDTDGESVRHPVELTLNEIERQVLAAIGTQAVIVDSVIADTGLAAHQVIATISVLEMRRLVTRVEGQGVRRL